MSIELLIYSIFYSDLYFCRVGLYKSVYCYVDSECDLSYHRHCSLSSRFYRIDIIKRATPTQVLPSYNMMQY